MFKYLVFVFVLSHGFPGYAFVYPDAKEEVARSLRDTPDDNSPAITEEISKVPTVTLNGNTNYHVGQQIFYVYGEQQFKKLFSPSKRTTSENVENDYLVTPGIGAHKLHRRKITWNKARKICIEEGGHLAIINSASEEKILLRLMQEKNIAEAWIGLHDLYEEGDWVTVTDEALENTGYSKWTTKFANLPDNYGGSQNCAVLITEGGIDDVSCTLTHSFFCEIPA
ncbi:hemolymph lipopolysaccharide-binding protein-like [Harpegnathos saltator]|uniref:hemolymph lipopolysaccharide-binding protein-like n=1 Tax=Harpegnathos saltator TaxID=610380 RepID=UPI00058D413D|nr:hemolymph lipopolysaccharide-binding protein-like [Harpegnathos saltator]